MTDFAGPTRFNHVAMSMPADALDEAGRADICAFYAEVFGWEEFPTMTEDRRRLVMGVHAYDQFVFLIAADEPMRTDPMDHFGMSVDSLDELDATLARAQQWQARDDRVRIVGPQVDDHEVLQLHSFYVGFLLPLMVEVQYFEWAA
ncbi:MAG: VOC family protein [Acidimicrobiia bacterium]|nr:VOC family protein [Acidimicrobiia bacterium]